jgi:hypothetical protein
MSQEIATLRIPINIMPGTEEWANILSLGDRLQKFRGKVCLIVVTPRDPIILRANCLMPGVPPKNQMLTSLGKSF